MVKVRCEFCNNTFQNISILNHHQKNAKYCLKIQSKEIKPSFQCQFCTKTLSSKQSLDRHSKVCSIKNTVCQEVESPQNILEKYNMKCRENVEMTTNDKISTRNSKITNKNRRNSNANQTKYN